MIKFDQKYFRKFDYSKIVISKYLKSAYKDLNIAKKSDVHEVVFQFSYNSLIKLGISLIAGHGYKINSRLGHHIKIIEKTAEILGSSDIEVLGNSMRKIRNSEMYDGGDISITKKQSEAYLKYIETTFKRSDSYFQKLLEILF